eukprot:CAMPEP_0194039868 /NCGR_PEP_ID=MMETSP0009_2-20130614/11949_1 /TAXON_ID=210454 /ORGANISM="Grammatophora oceanica, Strain CCMP 410" /LENGTH=115 /DNA_ID=CAMNT_0038682825 /DNA_START=186 /DNA_END=533 /DNA_ORIENTATION=+
MPKMITHLEDESTIGDSTVIAMDANGCCTRHPHIQLRVKGDDGLIYQQESCSECDKEFRDERLSLKEKKAELDRQLQELSEAPQQPDPAAAAGFCSHWGVLPHGGRVLSEQEMRE